MGALSYKEAKRRASKKKHLKVRKWRHGYGYVVY